jgi:hypothetical protein
LLLPFEDDALLPLWSLLCMPFDEFDAPGVDEAVDDCANAKLPAARTAAANATRRREGFEDFIAR